MRQDTSEASPMQARVRRLVESGELTLKVGPTFEFDRLQEAHELMDRNAANGKIVIELPAPT